MSAPAPLFKPFAWVPSHLQTSNYGQLARVHDIAAGVAVALELVERAQIDVEHGDPPLLGAFECGALMRLSIASMNQLRDEIGEQFAYMNKAGRPAPAAEQGDTA